MSSSVLQHRRWKPGPLFGIICAPFELPSDANPERSSAEQKVKQIPGALEVDSRIVCGSDPVTGFGYRYQLWAEIWRREMVEAVAQRQ